MTDHNHNFNNIDNIEFIRLINRAILDEAFKMLTEGLPGDNRLEPGKTMQRPVATKPVRNENGEVRVTIKDYDIWGERNTLLNRFARMWGKDTAVEFLGDIADTELKIEKQRPSGAAAAQENKRPPLSQKDIELLREFMRKDFSHE